MLRMLRSFEKNVKERKNVAFFWKECMPNPGKYVHLVVQCTVVHLMYCRSHVYKHTVHCTHII